MGKPNPRDALAGGPLKPCLGLSGDVHTSQTRLLTHFLDALFQHVHGYVGFFFGHHQRRAQAD